MLVLQALVVDEDDWVLRTQAKFGLFPLRRLIF